MRLLSSLRTKFALTYAVVIAVVLILMNTYSLTASRDMIFDSKQAFVQSQAAIIASSLEESFGAARTFIALTAEDVLKVMAQLNVTGVTHIKHITITGASGETVYMAADNYADMDSEFSRKNILKALEGYDVFYSRFLGGSFSSSAFAPVMNRGTIVGAVFVHEEDQEQGAILIDLQEMLKNISIIVILFSVAMLAFTLWTVMRRITSILKAIQSVREGEYSYRIEMNGNDELAILGDEFNSLTSRLRETEEMRRRFVANASHELKTPLASIRLLSDSILQNEGMNRDTVQEFISDIGAEAERLSRTTEKLMTLARLDSNVESENTCVDMKKVVISTLRMLTPLALRRGMIIDSTLEDDCFVFATEDSMHQVVFNIVENAIKYNKPDGSVDVKLSREGDGVLLTVDDTGEGVPEEELPFIFDRFYRVDKARSREAGGSGLGLAIVRDTVREHMGSVSAARRKEGGMRFQARFKSYTSGSCG